MPKELNSSPDLGLYIAGAGYKESSQTGFPFPTEKILEDFRSTFEQKYGDNWIVTVLGNFRHNLPDGYHRILFKRHNLLDVPFNQIPGYGCKGLTYYRSTLSPGKFFSLIDEAINQSLSIETVREFQEHINRTGRGISDLYYYTLGVYQILQPPFSAYDLTR